MKRSPLVTPGKGVNINAVNFKLTGKFTALGGDNISVGVNYIPAMTLNMSSKFKPRLYTSSDKAASSQLPESFSWANNDDVIKYKGSEYADVIIKPGNQLACGSCWAWATSQALSDRVAILSKSNNPQLGPSYILSCSLSDYCDGNSLQGCNGGNISVALDNMADNGASVPVSCWDYSWCKDNKNCVSGDNQDYNNTLIPNFAVNKDKCVSSSEKINTYKVKKGSVSVLGIAEQIKQQLFNKGPIPTGYFVYSDFFLGTTARTNGGKPDNWSKTNGVYIHLDTQPNDLGKYTTPSGDPPCYDYADPYDMNTLGGGHAVVIVGWGVTQIKNLLPVSKPDQTITVPYWIARNSWSSSWGDNGYFKIAMTNPSLYINTSVYFDTINQFGGGPIDFDIIANEPNHLLPETPTTPSTTTPQTTLIPNPIPSLIPIVSKASKSISYVLFLGLFIGLLIILLLVFVMFKIFRIIK